MQTWQFIVQKLSDGLQVILLFVLESKGSSPGRQGFNMAVASDGTIAGTIGGGIMEHKFVEMAKARFKQKVNNADVYQQVHDKQSPENQSGMICSGEQTIFLYRLLQHDQQQVEALINSMLENKNGTLQLSMQGISFSETIPVTNFYLKLSSDEDFVYREKTGYKNTLHIIGGGHCALALSRLMRELDFYIHVYDERKNLNTMEVNSFAQEKHIIKRYDELEGIINGGENVYVVIMTFGYRTDDLALRSLLQKKFKYIGLLGSKNKIEKMRNEYKKEHLDKELLNRVKAPIGIQVKSQTTAEIAISIAAEIISVKNANQ